jgi:hypothetical protein
MNDVLKKNFKPNLLIDEFLPESQPFAEAYSCPLCEGILYESVIDKCGHSFCKECSETLLKESSKCPFTNLELNPPLSFNLIVNSILDKQKVYCKNKNEKCDWIGKLSERKEHIQNDCPKQIIECEFSPDCTQKGFRIEMKEHIKNCPFKIIECEYCKEKINLKDSQNHYKICKNFPIECSNKCGKKIPLNELNNHIETECDLAETNCPFNLVGCEFYDLRKKVKEHLNSNLEKHLKMLTDKIKDLNEIISNQENTINNLNIEINDLKNEIHGDKNINNNQLNDLINNFNMLNNNLCNLREFIIIPKSNFVPNFYDKTLIRNDVFELDRDNFTIMKNTQNYGWYGISSEYLFEKNINISGNNSLTKSSMIEFNNNLDVIIINMKILNTQNSCVMFGLTWSENESPIENGFYSQTNEENKSIVFYCFNSAIYFKGIVNVAFENDKKCNEGEIITMIVCHSKRNIEFKKNGKLIHVFDIGNCDMMKIRACVDLCDYGDKIIFLR